MASFVIVHLPLLRISPLVLVIPEDNLRLLSVSDSSPITLEIDSQLARVRRRAHYAARLHQLRAVNLSPAAAHRAAQRALARHRFAFSWLLRSSLLPRHRRSRFIVPVDFETSLITFCHLLSLNLIHSGAFLLQLVPTAPTASWASPIPPRLRVMMASASWFRYRCSFQLVILSEVEGSRGISFMVRIGILSTPLACPEYPR